VWNGTVRNDEPFYGSSAIFERKLVLFQNYCKFFSQERNLHWELGKFLFIGHDTM
jgi:hypothetical protein